MAQAESFAYTGIDNLEAMASAIHYNAFLQGLVESAGEGKNDWLDFGAGTGQFAVPLTRLGKNVTALEPDQALAAQMRLRGVKVCTEITQIGDETIDFAYSLNVLEHIEDDQAALNMLARRLRPGGKLLIYVPAFNLIYSSMDALVGHHRRYTKSQLCKRVAAAGLTVERANYVDCLGFFASLVYKLLPGRNGTISGQSVAIYDEYVFPLSLALDRVASPFVGKNVMLVARKN